METRSQAKLRDTTSPPRVATVGGTQPVTDTFVEPPSSAAGHTGDGKVSSRSSSLEAGPRTTCRPIHRSESAGGACGLAQGDARDENRKVADAVDRERVLTPAPDEHANFTLLCVNIVLFWCPTSATRDYLLFAQLEVSSLLCLGYQRHYCY